MTEKNTSTNNLCGVCLAPGDSVNHLDHLAPLSAILDIPIVLDDPLLLETVEKYYPQVKPIYIDHHAKILEYLASNYDTLFVSSANYRKDLSPLLELIFRKKMHFWYCPHGNSDKPLRGFSTQEFSLIYGSQMEDRLKEESILPTLKGTVRTGNYRLTFYEKHKPFYDEMVEKEVFSQFKKKQTTLLYAPTWQDLQTSSSLFEAGMPILDQLPSHYNLIIKLHPWILHHQQGFSVMLEERYGHLPNIAVLGLYPLVMPILNKTDIYLGDFSSISYDFLHFNRPMFFFDPKERTDKNEPLSSHIHSCGALVDDKALENLFPFIEKHLKEDASIKAKRKALFDYAFGPELPFETIRNNVSNVVETSSYADA